VSHQPLVRLSRLNPDQTPAKPLPSTLNLLTLLHINLLCEETGVLFCDKDKLPESIEVTKPYLNRLNAKATLPGNLERRELILLDERNDVLCDTAIVRFIQKHLYVAGL